MIRIAYLSVITLGFLISLYGLFHWKSLSRPFKWLVRFLIFTSLSQYFAISLIYIIGYNLPWHKTAIICEHTLKFLIFVTLMNTQLMRRITRVLYFLSLALILYLIIPDFFVLKFSTQPLVVEYLTVCAYAFLFIFEMMKSSSTTVPHKDERFWLAIAMFFYQITAVAYFVLKEPMWVRLLHADASLEYVNYALMTIYYIILLASLVMHTKNQVLPDARAK